MPEYFDRHRIPVNSSEALDHRGVLREGFGLKVSILEFDQPHQRSFAIDVSGGNASSKHNEEISGCEAR